MKERPILFGAPMVRAILAGTKTQTRRIVKPRPTRVADGLPYGNGPAWAHADPGSALMHSPFGQPGDRLWVRETFANACNEVDAIAEGAPWAACGAAQEGSHKAGFAQLWESINGPDSWGANPWVWVVEFRRIES